MNSIREKQKTVKKDFMVPDEHFQSMCYWSTVRNLLPSIGINDFLITRTNRIDDVIVSMLTQSVVDRGFKPRSGKTKDYKICIFYFSTQHEGERAKTNQDNVSKWGNTSIRGLLFQWSSTIKIHLGMLVQYKVDLIIISSKINLFSS